MFRKLAFAAALLLSSCGAEPADLDVVTLYRSPIAGNEIIHVATFDAVHGQEYNAENCKIVADLMQSQPGVSVKYWCATGRAQPDA